MLCEIQVYNMLLSWVKYDLSKRQCCLINLIHKVSIKRYWNLKLISIKLFFVQVWCHPLKPKFIATKKGNFPIIQSTCHVCLKAVPDDLRYFIPKTCKPRQLDIPQVRLINHHIAHKLILT